MYTLPPLFTILVSISKIFLWIGIYCGWHSLKWSFQNEMPFCTRSFIFKICAPNAPVTAGQVLSSRYYVFMYYVIIFMCFYLNQASTAWIILFADMSLVMPAARRYATSRRELISSTVWESDNILISIGPIWQGGCLLVYFTIVCFILWAALIPKLYKYELLFSPLKIEALDLLSTPPDFPFHHHIKSKQYSFYLSNACHGNTCVNVSKHWVSGAFQLPNVWS